MDVFESKKLYAPEGAPIKAHYRDNFAEVFVAFLPLFRIDNKGVARSSVQQTHEITLDEFNRSQTGVELDQSIGEIYSNVNPEYPSDDEILKFAEPVRWSEVMTGVGLSSYAEVNKALRTTIGGYRGEPLRFWPPFDL